MFKMYRKGAGVYTAGGVNLTEVANLLKSGKRIPHKIQKELSKEFSVYSKSVAEKAAGDLKGEDKVEASQIPLKIEMSSESELTPHAVKVMGADNIDSE